MRAQEIYLLLVVIEHPLHVTGHMIHVNRMSAVGQHIDRTVLASDNHKGATVLSVEDIVIVKTAVHLGFLGMCQSQLLCRGRQGGS